MQSLPVCRSRSGALAGGRHECSSPKLIVGPSGVPDSLCCDCYCRDHAPIGVGVRPDRCRHLGRRMHEKAARSSARHCEPCGGGRVDVFACGHPATADEITLADCKVCRSTVLATSGTLKRCT